MMGMHCAQIEKSGSPIKSIPRFAIYPVRKPRDLQRGDENYSFFSEHGV